jgi:hypothetical protein
MKESIIRVKNQHPVLIITAAVFVAVFVVIGALDVSTRHMNTHGCQKVQGSTQQICGEVNIQD